jgi:hypothetical protein
VGRFVSCFACADLIRSHEVAQGKNNSISSYHQANRTNQTFQTISESRGSPGLLLYNGCRHGLRTRVTPSVWQRHVFGSEEFVCLAEACVWFRGVRSVNNWKPVVNTSFCLDLMILDKKNNRRPSLSVIACAQTACLGSFP